ncbi:hypothetical protein [Calothrix sp. 336/3]|uniref:hypothetical protein n=1 Tax=Calothrix sp. 336/3 TaxID=1337936 RepID=UPI0004E2F8C6|nr:hypothetical protein [Calothrix sp. 336/3]AKG21369.1 hypothetical protein IJ00_08755 [Calothrix sp. 336/3]
MTYKTDTQQALFAPFVEEAPVISPEEITVVRMSFWHNEIYTDDKLIAYITYEHNDFITQPWMVIVHSDDICMYIKEKWTANIIIGIATILLKIKLFLYSKKINRIFI